MDQRNRNDLIHCTYCLNLEDAPSLCNAIECAVL